MPKIKFNHEIDGRVLASVTAILLCHSVDKETAPLVVVWET